MPYSTLDPSDETTVFASKEAPLLALKLWPNRSLSRTGSFYLLLVVWFLMTIPMLALLGSSSFWGVVPFCFFTLLLLYLSLRKNYGDGEIDEWAVKSVYYYNKDKSHGKKGKGKNIKCCKFKQKCIKDTDPANTSVQAVD